MPHTYRIARSDEEIDNVMNAAAEQRDKGGSRWSGQTFEEGVLAALDWVFGNVQDNPMED